MIPQSFRAVSVEYPEVMAATSHRDLLARAHSISLPTPAVMDVVDYLTRRFGLPSIRIQFTDDIRSRTIILEDSIRIELSRLALSLGHLLHEVAHVMAHSGDHGPKFIACLDRFLEATERGWRGSDSWSVAGGQERRIQR